MDDLVPARFERAVVAIAGLALAASGAWIVPHDDGLAFLFLAPPFATGAIAAAIALTRRPAHRRVAIAVLDIVMMTTAVVYICLGTLAMVVPGMVAVAAFSTWFAIARHGDPEERAAREALATGVLWALPFTLAVELELDELAMRLAMIASVALAVAAAAWLHAIKRERAEDVGPPRATIHAS